MPMNNNSLKILHITLSSMIGGGPEHVLQLVRYFPKSITSFIAAPNRAPYGTRFMQTVGTKHLFTIPQRKISIYLFLKLLQFIRYNDIDIIHSHGKGAGLYGRIAALFTGIPNIHTFHGVHLPINNAKRQAYLLLERILCNISRTCIAVSPSEAEEVKSLHLCSNKLTTIVNGVEICAAVQHTAKYNPFLLVHVSRFDPLQKNSLWLLKLAQGLRQANLLDQCLFILIGDGEELPILRQQIHLQNMDKNFQILGSQPSVRPFLRGAGCYISTSCWEGLPLAVLEAQAEGVPAVVSRVVGNTDAIEDGITGFTYPLNDVSSAVSCIRTLINDYNIWQSMSKAAYKRARKHFSVEYMAQQTAELYKRVLASVRTSNL